MRGPSDFFVSSNANCSWQTSTEEHAERLEDARLAFTQEPSETNKITASLVEYADSIYFRGDNLLARAKELGF
jgi:hypothetical protein